MIFKKSRERLHKSEGWEIVLEGFDGGYEVEYYITARYIDCDLYCYDTYGGSMNVDYSIDTQMLMGCMKRIEQKNIENGFIIEVG